MTCSTCGSGLRPWQSSSYLLVAFYTHDKGALEAGVKYLVQSAVGSVLVLMGIAIVFSQVHSLQLDVIAAWDGVMTPFLFWLPERCL